MLASRRVCPQHLWYLWCREQTTSRIQIVCHFKYILRLTTCQVSRRRQVRHRVRPPVWTQARGTVVSRKWCGRRHGAQSPAGSGVNAGVWCTVVSRQQIGLLYKGPSGREGVYDGDTLGCCIKGQQAVRVSTEVTYWAAATKGQQAVRVITMVVAMGGRLCCCVYMHMVSMVTD